MKKNYVILIALTVLLYACSKDKQPQHNKTTRVTNMHMRVSVDGWHQAIYYDSAGYDSVTTVLLNNQLLSFPKDTLYPVALGDSISIIVDTTLLDRSCFLQFFITVTNDTTGIANTDYYTFDMDYSNNIFTWRVPIAPNANTGQYIDKLGNKETIVLGKY